MRIIGRKSLLRSLMLGTRMDVEAAAKDDVPSWAKRNKQIADD